jgi:hypothetical protein
MVVLCFSVQGENIIEDINGKCNVLYFNMQDEYILKNTTVKCHMCTL